MRIEQMTEISGKQVVGLTGVKALADNGDIEALNILGEWLLMGFECSPEEDYAVKCFEKAARKGNTQAMLSLGHCYIEGHGRKKDFDAAERWIRAAAELGDPEAISSCERLYLSTIAGHKPNLSNFIDALISMLPGEELPSGKELDRFKNDFIATVLLEKTGKSEKEIAILKEKVTENDIAAYESLRDIYYSDDEKIEKQVFDMDAYCSFILQNIEFADRRHLGKRIKLLYHLTAKKYKDIKLELLSLGKECFIDINYSEPLTWCEKAAFNFRTDYFGSFTERYVIKCMNRIVEQLYAIEENELVGVYARNKYRYHDLKKVRDSLMSSHQYSVNILDKWLDRITKRICQLEEESVTELFSFVADDYFLLIDLYYDVEKGTYEQVTKQKWIVIISERVKTIQEKYLHDLCQNLEQKSYQDLLCIYLEANNYSFQDNILHKYLAQIDGLINQHEIEQLEKMCSNSDDLTSEQYSKLLAEIDKAKYKSENKQKYITLITEKMDNAIVVESCTNEKLENYDIDQLNDRVKALHFSLLPKDVKQHLTQRVTYYIDLISECRDKVTLNLLEQCTPEQLKKQGENELNNTKHAIEKHPRLVTDEKAKILNRIEEQINLLHFLERLSKANKYKQLVSLWDDLMNTELPKEEVEQITNQLKSQIISKQKEELDRIISYSKMGNHDIIIESIEKAKAYSFNNDIYSQAIKLLNSRINDLENENLDKMCVDMDQLSSIELIELKKRIIKLEYQKENVSQYIKKIENKWDEVNYNELIKKCTASNLVNEEFNTDDCKNLLCKLNFYRDSERIIIPYLERVNNVLLIKQLYQQDICTLFLKDISEEREFVVAVIADSNNDSYIYGKALDTKCNYWKKVITESERPIFIFNKPKEKHNKPCGICVTNQNIYIYESKTDINILPINEINEINTSGKNDSISFTTETKDFRYEVCSSLEMRVNLTNLLIRMVNFLLPRYNKLIQEKNVIEQGYTKKITDCFINYSIPGEQVDKVEAIENSTARGRMSYWLCSCGTTNNDNFCVNCGSKRESGIELWICQCGNYSKGKFCSKCGTPRKDG